MRAGISEAAGDLLVFLDADVIGLDVRFVERLLGLRPSLRRRSSSRASTAAPTGESRPAAAV